MKSRDALIRLKRFEVEEKRRKVAEIESMIGEFGQMAADLDRQIAIEQERRASPTSTITPTRPSPRPRCRGAII